MLKNTGKDSAPAAMETNTQPSFLELSPKETSIFVSKLRAAKKASPFGAAVDVHTPTDYRTSRMFLTRDGMAGYAVTSNGELTSVFNHPDSPYKDVARHAAEHGILIGGARYATAFDPKLPALYARGGMEAVGRVPFNREYAPSDWKYRLQGTPDVLFLAANREVAHPALSGAQTYRPGSAPLFEGESGADEAQALAEKIGETSAAMQLGTAGQTYRKSANG